MWKIVTIVSHREQLPLSWQCYTGRPSAAHMSEQQPTWWQIIGEGAGLEQESGSQPAKINLQGLE